eukprot:2937161-Pyramimonas_sp.AAC.1
MRPDPCSGSRIREKGPCKWSMFLAPVVAPVRRSPEVLGFCVGSPDNVELGTSCGRYYRVGCLSITDPGTPHLTHIP